MRIPRSATAKKFFGVLGLLILCCGCSQPTLMTVTPTGIVSIIVSPLSVSVPLGVTHQFTAIGTFADGSTQDITTSVSWSSSSTTVAVISNSVGSQGLATSAAVGTTTITATSGSVTSSTTLTVGNAQLVSLAVTPVNPAIVQGSTQPFTATGTFTDGSTQDLTNSVTWNSSNTAVASINGTGLVTGVGTGTTTVAAASGSISGSTTLVVTVVGPVLTSVIVTPPNPSVSAGATQQFTATGVFSNGSTLDETAQVTWTSSSSSATISNVQGNNGLATSVTQGSTTITATLGSISGSASLSVTAAALKSIAITPLSVSVPLGVMEQFTATGTFTDNSTQNITATVMWSTSPVSIATISNASGSQGLALTVALGTVTVTASQGITIGSAQLVVVPSQGLEYGTYLGGSSEDVAHGIAVGSDGSMCVTGYTASNDFPVLNAYQSTKKGTVNAFLFCFNTDGSLRFSTYFGGSGTDKGEAITIGPTGNLYITGVTDSRDFPVTPGVVQPGKGEGTNAYVVQFTPQGALVWSTYWGTTSTEANTLAVDSSGNVFVAGDTSGAGGMDAYVLELNAAATAVIWSNTFGGSGVDSVRSIALLGEEAYVTGYTNSTDFPVTAGVVQPSCGSACTDYYNGFVAKLGAGGVSYATYLGGTVTSVASTTLNLGIGIAVDSSGDAYITGMTNTTDFPTTTGAFQRTFGGVTDLPGGLAACIDFIGARLPCGDAFVTKISPDGSTILASTYLGGSTADIGYTIRVDALGNVYVFGYTQSNASVGHTPFPTTPGAFQTVKAGGLDAFFSKLSNDCSTLLYSTYYGGTQDEEAFGGDVDSAGNGYLSGWTDSANLPLANPYQPTFKGVKDAFVAKIQP
jgi:hypothetical protein